MVSLCGDHCTWVSGDGRESVRCVKEKESEKRCVRRIKLVMCEKN